MTDAENRKPDWQASLEHHEDLCSARYEASNRNFQSVREEIGALRDKMRSNNQAIRDEVKSSNQAMRDDIRELRIGQRWMVGVMLTWPPLIIASLRWIPW